MNIHIYIDGLCKHTHNRISRSNTTIIIHSSTTIINPYKIVVALLHYIPSLPYPCINHNTISHKLPLYPAYPTLTYPTYTATPNYLHYSTLTPPNPSYTTLHYHYILPILTLTLPYTTLTPQHSTNL